MPITTKVSSSGTATEEYQRRYQEEQDEYYKNRYNKEANRLPGYWYIDRGKEYWICGFDETEPKLLFHTMKHKNEITDELLKHWGEQDKISIAEIVEFVLTNLHRKVVKDIYKLENKD